MIEQQKRNLQGLQWVQNSKEKMEICGKMLLECELEGKMVEPSPAQRMMNQYPLAAMSQRAGYKHKSHS